jgi:hypothetical protein
MQGNTRIPLAIPVADVQDMAVVNEGDQQLDQLMNDEKSRGQPQGIEALVTP